MKAKHGVILMIISLLLKALAEVTGTIYTFEFGLWSISNALWTIGLLVVLVKALNHPGLKEFLES